MPTPHRGQLIERDHLVTGFGVRKTATGHTAFIFNYTASGRDRRMTIGQYPAWSVTAARQVAAKLRMQVDAGHDPLEEQRVARAEYTLSELWAEYENTILPRKAASTQRDERSIWRRLILPALGRKKLSHVRNRDVENLIRRISEQTPVQANRCIASIRHVYNTAIKWELATYNPVKGIEKNPETPRHRYLDRREWSRFMQALEAREDTPSTLAIHFLLLTGARRGEVFKATWDQIDFDEMAWTKPSSHTKQKRLHRVPLSDVAVAVLRRAKAISTGPQVFPGAGGNALTDIKRTFRSICDEAAIDGFRLHDLRHSFASALVSRGTSLPIIGGLLGHTQVSTTARYAHLADASMRTATNLLNNMNTDVQVPSG
jgi:integrase